MTALAVYLKEKGFAVSGSDVKEKFSTDAILEENSIPVLTGFNPLHINHNLRLVVSTGAHGGATNPESLEAKKLKIPFYMHGEYMGIMQKGKFTIAVSGCHGKTTTASMIAFILKSAGLDPSYAIGTAYINELGAAGHCGKSKYLIVEADEYMTCPLTDPTPRFLWLTPDIGVITNIEFDHPDRYGNLEDIKKVFLDFSDKVKKNGILLVNLDNPVISEMTDKFPGGNILTYGFSPRAEFRIDKIQRSGMSTQIRITNKSLFITDLLVNIPGKHNLLNSLCSAIVANLTGLSWKNIRDILKNYTGCNRRFELIRRFKNNFLYDDYAHHPSEIRSTLSAFKERFPGHQLLVIFQPHTFSRTKSLFADFSASFLKADQVYITDIFPSAREKFDSTVSSSMLVRKMNTLKKNAFYINDKQSALNCLTTALKKTSVIVTMGAGNLNQWHPFLIRFLKSL